MHYCGGYKRGLVSADYFGHYAAALEAEYDAGDGRPAFIGIMSNGTSGDVGAVRYPGPKYPPFEKMQVSARALAETTRKTIGGLEHRADVALAMQERELELGVRRPDAEARGLGEKSARRRQGRQGA